ncbi:hypothetical protein Tco_0175219 [Tanacetum coccineum]
MRTRSQTHNRDRQQQDPPAVVEPFNLEEPFDNPPLVSMADNRTMAELLQAPIEGYKDAIVIPEINANFELKHGLINLVQNKQFFGHDKEDPHAHIHTFYNALNANDQDSLNSTAGGNFLDKMPRECLKIIESKSKVRNSRNKAVVAKVSSNSSTPGISPDVAALTTEVSELKNMMKTMLIDKQKAQAPVPVKAVEQSCVTCGGAHSYRNCPATDGNVYRDNIQEYVSQAAAANFNQGNTNSRPPMVANQIRPPGFPPIQNNQNRFNQNQGNNFNQNRGTNFNQNRGNNFYQGQVYQPPTSQPPVYQAHPYQAPAPQMQGPLTPTPVVSTPLKEPEQNPETSINKVQKSSSENTAQVPPLEDHDSIFNEIPKPKAKKTFQEPNSPEPNSYQPKLPYPERMKVREKDIPSAQQSRFMKLFKQLRLEFGLKDALIEMLKFNKWLSTLLRNKEKLEEIAITTVNAECSAIFLNKVPEKLKDPGKFLISVDGFTSADFVVVNFKPDPRVPIILGSPFLYTAKALIDLYEEKLTLRVGSDELVFYAEKSKKSKNKQFAHAISIIDFSKDEPFSGSTTNHSDALPPSSSPVKTSEIHEEFADELTLLKKSNVNPLFNEMVEDVENENSNVSNSDEPVLLNTPLSDKVECFDSEDNIDEIDTFLAMEVSSNFEEGYSNSEEDIIFLENLLSDDTTHNLAPEENVHPSSIPVEDSDPVQEEIDIFLVPDDLIPPGVENDDSEDEDNELPNLDHQDNPSSPRPLPEPPYVCLNFKPDTTMKNDEEIVLSLNVADVNSFTFVIWTFLSFFTYPEDSPVILSLRSKGLVFDPRISTFHFSLKLVPFALPKDE